MLPYIKIITRYSLLCLALLLCCQFFLLLSPSGKVEAVLSTRSAAPVHAVKLLAKKPVVQPTSASAKKPVVQPTQLVPRKPIVPPTKAALKQPAFHGTSAGQSVPTIHYTYIAYSQGPYTISGNQVYDAHGRLYLFHGVTRDGLEYTCTGVGAMDSQHLSYMGRGVSTGGVIYWNANTIRLPVTESYWLYGSQRNNCTAQQYRANVHQVIDMLTQMHLNVILDLHWSDAGHQSLEAGGPWALPDADSVTFWRQAANTYRGYGNVLFELYNEPHPASWQCWYDGCPPTTDTTYSNECGCPRTITYQSVGMKQLVETVRAIGARNIVIVAGMNWGFDLSQIDSYPLPGVNIMYDTHPYPYTEKMLGHWDTAFGNASKTHAIISAENGQYDCRADFMATLYDYFDQHGISWVGWAWTAGSSVCGYPLLVEDLNGTPSHDLGEAAYERLQTYDLPATLVKLFHTGH